jgi:hypothetical protein
MLPENKKDFTTKLTPALSTAFMASSEFTEWEETRSFNPSYAVVAK